MSKKKQNNYEDEEWPPAEALGIGAYQFNSGGSGKSKFKHRIGFVRQPVAMVKRPIAQNARKQKQK